MGLMFVQKLLFQGGGLDVNNLEQGTRVEFNLRLLILFGQLRARVVFAEQGVHLLFVVLPVAHLEGGSISDWLLVSLLERSGPK